MKSVEDLDVFKLANEITLDIYNLTNKTAFDVYTE